MHCVIMTQTTQIQCLLMLEKEKSQTFGFKIPSFLKRLKKMSME